MKPEDPLTLARVRDFIKQCDDIVLPAIGLSILMNYILPKLKNRWEEEDLEQFIARKLDQQSVTRGLDDAALSPRDGRFDQFIEMSVETRSRSRLVLAH